MSKPILGKCAYVTELWTKANKGPELTVTYNAPLKDGDFIRAANFDAAIASLAMGDGHDEVWKNDFDNNKTDRLSDLERLGWSFVKELKREIYQPTPFLTVHTVYDELVRMAPELSKDPLKVQALLKRFVHVEKLSAYERMRRYFAFERDLEVTIERLLPLKSLWARIKDAFNPERVTKQVNYMLAKAQSYDEVLRLKIETHKDYAVSPDAEIITWDVPGEAPGSYQKRASESKGLVH